MVFCLLVHYVTDGHFISNCSLLKTMNAELYKNFSRVCLESMSGSQVEARTCPRSLEIKHVNFNFLGTAKYSGEGNAVLH